MKNAERKKRKPSNLVVSIPRNLLHIQVCPELSLSLCSEEPSVDDSHLTVSLPLSAFVDGRVRSLQQLTSHMSTLTVSLPWVITCHIPLILCKTEVADDHEVLPHSVLIKQ